MRKCTNLNFVVPPPQKFFSTLDICDRRCKSNQKKAPHVKTLQWTCCRICCFLASQLKPKRFSKIKHILEWDSTFDKTTEVCSTSAFFLLFVFGSTNTFNTFNTFNIFKLKLKTCIDEGMFWAQADLYLSASKTFFTLSYLCLFLICSNPSHRAFFICIYILYYTCAQLSKYCNFL